MTAIVTLDAGLPLDDPIAVDMDDFDFLKGSHSRLRMGATLAPPGDAAPRADGLREPCGIEPCRHYPGGTPAIRRGDERQGPGAWNDPDALHRPDRLAAQNVSTASDLATLVSAAAQYPLIANSAPRRATMSRCSRRAAAGLQQHQRLVKSSDWDIQVSKTGFIREAGKCLVMMATISSRPVVIVLLDSFGRYTRIADAVKVKYWLETGETMPVRTAKAAKHAKASSKKAGVKATSGKMAQAVSIKAGRPGPGT